MAESVDKRIVRVAMAHGGACTRAELLAAGVGAGSISRRVDDGTLDRVASGTFVVPLIATEQSLLHAALLAMPEARVSRQAAARLHGYSMRNSGLTVTAPRGHCLPVVGVDVEETRRLPAEHLTMVDGLACTTPERTLFDLAASASPQVARLLVEAQLMARCPDADTFVAFVSEWGGRGVTGSATVRELLAELVDDQPFPESKLEQLLFNGLAAHGVDGIQRQFRPPWYDGRRGIVDGADEAGRTIIEADGRRFRQVTAAHDNDRSRDLDAAANGWLVVRVGWRSLTEQPEATLERVATVIRSRRLAAPHPSPPN